MTKVFAAAVAAGLALALVPSSGASPQAAAIQLPASQVSALQVALRAWGLYDGPIDAVAGAGTLAAVRAVPAAGRPAGRRDRRAPDEARARAARPAASRPARARAGSLRLGRLAAAVRPHPRRLLPLARRRVLRPRNGGRAASLPARPRADRGRRRRSADLRASRGCRRAGEACSQHRARPTSCVPATR